MVEAAARAALTPPRGPSVEIPIDIQREKSTRPRRSPSEPYRRSRRAIGARRAERNAPQGRAMLAGRRRREAVRALGPGAACGSDEHNGRAVVPEAHRQQQHST